MQIHVPGSVTVRMTPCILSSVKNAACFLLARHLDEVKLRLYPNAAASCLLHGGGRERDRQLVAN